MAPSPGPWISRNPPPYWQARAESMVGKSVLVGITRHSAGDEFIGREQFFGLIESVDNVKGFCLRTTAGEIEWLPPVLNSFERAEPGEYRLKSTGELVEDPDFISTWVLNEAPK